MSAMKMYIVWDSTAIKIKQLGVVHATNSAEARTRAMQMYGNKIFVEPA